MTDLLARLLNPAAVAFTTPGVDRVFLACKDCRRVKPHYHIYPAPGEPERGFCRCGSSTYRVRHLPEIVAAWWVLGVGWLWRKTLWQKAQWDPRLPIRHP